MCLSSSQYAPETDRFLRPRRHNKIDSLPPVWRSSALLRDQLLAELEGLGSRRLHFRAWSRANTLVPAAADKVREAFQVRLADPKPLPIPLGRACTTHLQFVAKQPFRRDGGWKVRNESSCRTPNDFASTGARSDRPVRTAPR